MDAMQDQSTHGPAGTVSTGAADRNSAAPARPADEWAQLDAQLAESDAALSRAERTFDRLAALVGGRV
jgi:hypothetical protein